MPRFSTVVVCISLRPILVSSNIFGKADYLRAISRILLSFSSSSVSSPLLAFETFPRRDLAFISALQYPVALIAKLIKSGSVSTKPESAERADGPVDPGQQYSNTKGSWAASSAEYTLDGSAVVVTCENIDIMKESKCLKMSFESWTSIRHV